MTWLIWSRRRRSSSAKEFAGSGSGRNEAHDARCYEIIFADRHPDTKFVSSGSSKEVQGDRLRFAAIFPEVIRGITVRRLIDRDDHSPADVEAFKAEAIQTLGRRNIRSYLYDEEVLRALYEIHGKLDDFPALEAARAKAISDSIARVTRRTISSQRPGISSCSSSRSTCG